MAEMALSQLPKGWIWTTLIEVSAINPKFSGEEISEDTNVSFVPMRSVEELSGRMDLSLTKQLREVKKGYTPFINGDLLFAKITPCMENGKIAIANDLKNGLGFGSTEFHVIRLPDLFNKKFFFYYLIQARVRDDAKRNMKGTAGQLRVPPSFMHQLAIPLPPLPEQHRIVAKVEELFSDLEAGVEALKKAKAQLKLYRQAVLKAAFAGRLTAAWREAHKGKIEPAIVLLERIREERRRRIKGKHKEPFPFTTSKLPELPDRWLWVPFFEVGEAEKNAIVDGPFGSNLKVSDYVKNGEIPVISITNIDVGYNKRNIRFITKNKYETIKRSAVNPGDIIMAKIGSSYGKSGIYPEWMPTGIIPANLIKITISRSLIKKYAYYYLKSLFFKDKLDGITKSTAQPAFNVTAFKMIPFPFPPYNEQERIVDEIEYRFSLADDMEKSVDQSLKQSERLRQSILKQAFVGGLVPQDPEDEPAAELLERIKGEKARHPAGRRSHAGIKRTGKLW
jgi:type I restriction enzyme S subunit